MKKNVTTIKWGLTRMAEWGLTRMADNSPPYNKYGPNSNTFQKELIKKLGLKDPFDNSNAPQGYNTEVPNAWKQ